MWFDDDDAPKAFDRTHLLRANADAMNISSSKCSLSRKKGDWIKRLVLNDVFVTNQEIDAGYARQSGPS